MIAQKLCHISGNYGELTTPMPENPNLSLNPLFNAFVTDCCNTLRRNVTDTELEFIRIAYRINVISGIPFSYLDFTSKINHNYFRQIIHKLKPIIILKIKGKPKYYQLKGLYLDEKLTEKYTAMPIEQRMFTDFELILSMIKHEPPAIHDIRLDATTCGLYDKLIKLGHTPNKKNKIITLSYDQLTPNIETKVNVHTTGTILVILGCTYHPIPYSDDGFITLISHLGSVRTALGVECHSNFQIEPILNWRFKMFDFNKDGISYNFPTNDYTIHTVFAHVRIYKKRMLEGSTIFRLEKQVLPNTTISEELYKSDFRRASELIDLKK